jgi:hypothetical protein
MSAVTKVRNLVLAVFALILFVVAIMLTITMIALVAGEQSRLYWDLGDDVAVGVRLVIFVIGAGLIWLMARALYKQLVKGLGAPDDASNIAVSLMAYLMLTVAVVAFLGAAAQIWLPILFLIVLLWSSIAVWRLVGSTMTLGTVTVAMMAIVTTWYLVS